MITINLAAIADMNAEIRDAERAVMAATAVLDNARQYHADVVTITSGTAEQRSAIPEERFTRTLAAMHYGEHSEPRDTFHARERLTAYGKMCEARKTREDAIARHLDAIGRKRMLRAALLG